MAHGDVALGLDGSVVAGPVGGELVADTVATADVVVALAGVVKVDRGAVVGVLLERVGVTARVLEGTLSVGTGVAVPVWAPPAGADAGWTSR